MTSLGLDYATLSAANPRLIYASISGYGQTGPERGKGGFDLIAQGVAGIMSITGEPGGPPVKAGVPVTDLGAGLFALVGILAALEHRHRTGRRPARSTRRWSTPASRCRCGRRRSISPASACPTALGSAHRMNAPYQAIRCADGYITLGAANERLFRRLCEVLGHAEWSADPAFADNASRVKHREALAARIESITVDAAARALAGAARSERHPVRADQRLRAGVRGSAGAGARDGRRDGAPDARASADARLADQDERDAARRLPPRAAARRAHRRSADGSRARRRGDRGAAGSRCDSAESACTGSIRGSTPDVRRIRSLPA